MSNIAVIGTGYVGLVTGVCLADIGHHVTCIDMDPQKIEKLKLGITTIYEPGLEELINKNIQVGRLHFTDNHKEGLYEVDIIMIAVGTPQAENGAVNLHYIEGAAKQIATHLTKSAVVVTKSTVPVGTNDLIKRIINANLLADVEVEVVSNPEFLREGSAIKDTFHGDRIVIGANNEHAGSIVEAIYKPFNIPVFKTDIRSAEMIKYAANAFLATKISFINEIALLCEKLGANVEDVAYGMGQDSRIGLDFLKAGIGYGGSCFPKDTKALCHIAKSVGESHMTLQSVIRVNEKQQLVLVDKAKKRFGSLQGKKCTLLGLAFKPNTDDMREAPSIAISNRLLAEGAEVYAYDPIAMGTAKTVLPTEVRLMDTIEAAITGADLVFIVTEWEEFVTFPIEKFIQLMNEPIIFDGRNCFSLTEIEKHLVEYHSIGRPSIYKW